MENRNINTTTSGLHKALDVYSSKISELRAEASSLAELILEKGSSHWTLDSTETQNVLQRIEDIKSERERLDSYKQAHLNKFTDATPSCNE